MEIVKEIREAFASGKNPSARKIISLPDEFPAYVIRISDGYGVAIEIDDKMEVSERFNSCRLHTGYLSIDKSMKNYLILRSAFEDYRYEFASICAEFVDPGDGGKNRKEILENPYVWWSRWKELMGNTNRELRAYNIIAEMGVLLHKFKMDPTTEWAATRISTHDIECSDESCEVKSTIKRYGTEITISSQYQLEHKKRLFIYFCKLEESLEGISINDMKKKLIDVGYDEGKLERELEKQGFERGTNIRNKKYKILEKRKYEVDDKFPRIVQTSFKEDKYPDYITHIEYTIDLEGITYTEW